MFTSHLSPIELQHYMARPQLPSISPRADALLPSAQSGCFSSLSEIIKFPSPLPSLMHYLPPGTAGLNESSPSQLSKVQDMLSMEKQHTAEKQKVRDYLAATYSLLRKSQQSTAKPEHSRHSFTYGSKCTECLDSFQPNSPISAFATITLE